MERSVMRMAWHRGTAFVMLDKGLDAAEKHDWTVVDMKRDWKVIYPDKDQQ